MHGMVVWEALAVTFKTGTLCDRTTKFSFVQSEEPDLYQNE